MLNWNDLKIVLAIKRHQTFAAAGKRLRLNQTTVARRLSSIEEALDARLFHRHDRDLLATEIGEQVCLHAERVEAEFNALQQKVLGTDSRPEGDIRLTTTPLLLEYLLLPHLKPFLRQYPAIHWEFISDSNDLSLSKREADIALRLARPNEGKAITRRLGQIDYAVYAHRDIADKKPRWIAYSKDKLYLPLAAEAERLTVADRRAPLRMSSETAVWQAVKQGLGQALMPCFAAEQVDDLVQVTEQPHWVRREVWLMVHPELRRTARIDQALQWLDSLFDSQGVPLKVGSD